MVVAGCLFVRHKPHIVKYLHCVIISFMSLNHASVERSSEYAHEHSINVRGDITMLGVAHEDTTALLAILNSEGITSEHCTETGADYQFSQLDYLTGHERIKRASRYIAAILGGQRTELAYWAGEAPKKKLTVHQGVGELVIGKPHDGTTAVYRLDPEVTPEVTLPPGRFYTFVADLWTPSPLVVSGLYEEEVNWSGLEKTIEPGQTQVECGGKTIEVPSSFASRYE